MNANLTQFERDHDINHQYLDNKIKITHYPIKEQLMEEHYRDNGYNYITFKRASKRMLIDSVKGITKDNVVKDCDVVKNAIVFVKDHVLYCKHYDTIIFAYDLQRRLVLEFYKSCSLTSDRQLGYIRNFLVKIGEIERDDYTFWDTATKSEPTIRGHKNKFWEESYGGLGY